MMELVNGYVCRDCTDVSLAKRGIDPAHPPGKPGAPDAKDDTKNGGKPGSPGDLAAAASPTSLGASQPLADGPRGTVLNLLA
jgi:hypothetical protein